MDAKRILVLGINFSPEPTGIGKYTGEMVDWLAGQGHQVTVITAFPYYPYWKIQQPYKGRFYKKEIYSEGRIEVYRCPLYVPSNPGGFSRILHDASFFLSSLPVMILQLLRRKHDRVICISPPFHMGFQAWMYRLLRSSSMLYHIQDLQIDAAKDLYVIRSKWLIRMLFSMERFILKRSDHVSSISDGMLRKIASKVNRELLLFPNWVDIDAICPLPDRNKLKQEWGFSESNRVVLYSGSIGEKQGLDVLLELAERCRDSPEIRFLICGTGPYKNKLESLAKERKLDNVSFLPLQDASVFNHFLNMADVHLVLQKTGASDLVMPSKLTGILSAGGLAIATAVPGTSLYDVIHTHQMGILVEPENSEELLTAIREACSGRHDEKRIKARIYAEKFLDKEAIMKNLAGEFL